MKDKTDINSKENQCVHAIMNPIHLYFSVIYRHGKIMHDRAMKKFEITGQQMEYIKYVNDNPGTPQEKLARYLRIDKGAVAKSVKDLVEKGYIERTQNPDDKRAYCLSPTEKAIKIHEEGEALFGDFKMKLTDGMTDEEIETLVMLLGKLTDNITDMLEGGKI